MSSRWTVIAMMASALLVGCDADGPAAGASPSAEPEPTATASPAARTGPRPAEATPGVMSSAADRPIRPTDPVGGFRVLSGTVESGDGCRVIRSGGERWALVGVLAGTLQVGGSYEIRGRTVAVPGGCPSDRAVDVSQARRS